MRHRFSRVLSALAVDPVKRTPPARRDWVLVVALIGLGAIELAFGDITWPVPIGIATLIALAGIPWRRVHSLTVAMAAFGAEFGVEVAASFVDGVPETLATTFAQDLAGLFLLYAVCRWERPDRVVFGAAVIAAFVYLGPVIGGEGLVGALGFLFPWGVVAGFALAMRYRGRLGEAQVTQARLIERNTLARELHDSVAHHVSAIAVQAQAARFVVDKDPAAAAAAIAHIEETANVAIDEMRRMVGVLRSDDDQARTVAADSLAAFADLEGNPKVTLTDDVSLVGLPAPVATAAFRIVQESITNAKRHSDGVTFVDVRCVIGETHVELEVINDGTPTSRNRGGGFGLVGMNERAEALDGTLESGPRSGSSWRVLARLPIARAS